MGDGPVDGDELSVRRDATDAVLFRGLYPGLRRFAAAVGPDEMDPDDIVQEAVARALARGRLSDLHNPSAYLRTAIVRVTSNERRRLGRWRRARARAGLVEEALAADCRPSDLDDLSRLSAADRALLYLTVVEDLTLREAAEILGCSEGAARMRRHRALQSLRNALERETLDE